MLQNYSSIIVNFDFVTPDLSVCDIEMLLVNPPS